jgi:CDP-4-dehydro-6-deoxyglucose reductase, E3
MSCQVEIRPSGHVVETHPGESLLDSALAAGLAVNYGCSNGNCGKCKARRVQGELEPLRHSDFVFARGELEQGWFLMCCHGARTDAVIDTGVARDTRDIEFQEIEVKVRKVAPLDAHYTLLHVQTPRTRRLRFLAGQWARLSMGEQSCRLPIASCPCDDRNIHFHIPNDPGLCPGAGRLTRLRPGATLHLAGPEGDFALDMDSTRPRVMVGAGAGMAPLGSIIEHSLALAPGVSVELLLLEEADAPHYLHNSMRSWRDALDDFSFRSASPSMLAPTLAGMIAAQGRAEEIDCYVAGPQPLVEAAAGVLAQCGVPATRVHSCPVW